MSGWWRKVNTDSIAYFGQGGRFVLFSGRKNILIRPDKPLVDFCRQTAFHSNRLRRPVTSFRKWWLMAVVMKPTYQRHQ